MEQDVLTCSELLKKVPTIGRQVIADQRWFWQGSSFVIPCVYLLPLENSEARVTVFLKYVSNCGVRLSRNTSGKGVSFLSSWCLGYPLLCFTFTA